VGFALLVVLPSSLIFSSFLNWPFNLRVPRSSPATGEGREAFDFVGSGSQENFKTSHPSHFEGWGTPNFKPTSSELQETTSLRSALALAIKAKRSCRGLRRISMNPAKLI